MAAPDVNGEDPRQRVIRQATFYARLFGGAAVAVALAGSAVIARLTLPGLPFLTAWVLVLGSIGLLVLAIVAVRDMRARRAPRPDVNGSTDSQSEG